MTMKRINLQAPPGRGLDAARPGSSTPQGPAARRPDTHSDCTPPRVQLLFYATAASPVLVGGTLSERKNPFT